MRHRQQDAPRRAGVRQQASADLSHGPRFIRDGRLYAYRGNIYEKLNDPNLYTGIHRVDVDGIKMGKAQKDRPMSGGATQDRNGQSMWTRSLRAASPVAPRGVHGLQDASTLLRSPVGVPKHTNAYDWQVEPQQRSAEKSTAGLRVRRTDVAAGGVGGMGPAETVFDAINLDADGTVTRDVRRTMQMRHGPNAYGALSDDLADMAQVRAGSPEAQLGSPNFDGDVGVSLRDIVRHLDGDAGSPEDPHAKKTKEVSVEAKLDDPRSASGALQRRHSIESGEVGIVDALTRGGSDPAAYRRLPSGDMNFHRRPKPTAEASNAPQDPRQRRFPYHEETFGDRYVKGATDDVRRMADWERQMIAHGNSPADHQEYQAALAAREQQRAAAEFEQQVLQQQQQQQAPLAKAPAPQRRHSLDRDAAPQAPQVHGKHLPAPHTIRDDGTPNDTAWDPEAHPGPGVDTWDDVAAFKGGSGPPYRVPIRDQGGNPVPEGPLGPNHRPPGGAQLGSALYGSGYVWPARAAKDFEDPTYPQEGGEGGRKAVRQPGWDEVEDLPPRERRARRGSTSADPDYERLHDGARAPEFEKDHRRHTRNVAEHYASRLRNALHSSAGGPAAPQPDGGHRHHHHHQGHAEHHALGGPHGFQHGAPMHHHRDHNDHHHDHHHHHQPPHGQFYGQEAMPHHGYHPHHHAHQHQHHHHHQQQWHGQGPEGYVAHGEAAAPPPLDGVLHGIERYEDDRSTAAPSDEML